MRPVGLWPRRLAAVVAFSVLARLAAGQPVPIRGTVVDSSGSPIAGATVASYVFSSTGIGFDLADLDLEQQVGTDAQGAFELASRSGIRARLLVARKAGLAPAWLQMGRPSAQPRNLVLTPPGVLAGTVVDETDKLVSGADVSVTLAVGEVLTPSGGRSVSHIAGKPARELFNARSDAQGRFRIEGFPTKASASLQVRVPGKALRPPSAEILEGWII